MIFVDMFLLTCHSFNILIHNIVMHNFFKFDLKWRVVLLVEISITFNKITTQMEYSGTLLRYNTPV